MKTFFWFSSSFSHYFQREVGLPEVLSGRSPLIQRRPTTHWAGWPLPSAGWQWSRSWTSQLGLSCILSPKLHAAICWPNLVITPMFSRFPNEAAVHGVAGSRTRLSNFTFTFHFHALEKEMTTHSSVLAWRIPGMGETGGLPSMGSQSQTWLKRLSSSI